MGRASRWFRGLLGLKKERDQNGLENSNVTATYGQDRKEKKRWSFAKPGKDSGGQIPLTDDFNECSWRRSYIAAESEDEQNKHAIAVAAATAAAADAAVFAAQAAVAVVRLTSNNRGALFVGNRERLAAVRIQSVFRGYLARKALRALKGLVKLQALVRGFLVRKRASAALSCMEALVRAQIAVKLQRSRRSFNKENRFQPRKSMEKRLDDSKTQFHSKRLSTSYETTYNLFSESPKIVEVDTYKPRSRSRRVDNFEDHPVSSPLLYPAIAIPENRYEDLEWSFIGDEIKFSTAHNTPRFRNSVKANSPATPAKSVCGDGYFKDFSNSPNYMSSTKSYMAKLRSNSAPKQRPEPAPKKMMSLSEIMASRRSVSGVRMHRMEPENQETLNC